MFQLRITTIRQKYIDWYKINKQSKLWNLSALTFLNIRNPLALFQDSKIYPLYEQIG